MLARLSGTLAHRGPDGEGRWIQGPVGLACRTLRVAPEASAQSQPLVHSSGTVLVFDGRLDNREELLAALKNSPGISAGSSDAALVLAAYQTFGTGFPERLLGDFALALFDPQRKQLLLARDALGVRPLYYYQSRDTFLFASEIKALLAHPGVPARPNEEDLADCLLMRRAYRDSQACTFFKDISSLLPAHLAILNPQGFLAKRYWDFDTTRRLRLRTFQEYAEAFRGHFERAVRRRLRSASPVAVTVSGGLDSSAIFCLAETLRQSGGNHHPPLIGISYTSTDGSPADENAFVAEIERAYGISIERVPLTAGLLSNCQEAIWHSEVPYLDVLGDIYHRALETSRQRGARVVLAGFWGDQVLFDQGYLIDLFHRLAWGTIRTHLNEFARWYTDVDAAFFKKCFLLDLVKCHLPAPLFPLLRKLRAKLTRGQWNRPWFTEAFRKQGRGFASQQAFTKNSFVTAQTKSLYEMARSWYEVLTMEKLNKLAAMHSLEMAFPFLDRDLVSFVMAAPGEMQNWQGVPRATLRRALRGVLPQAIAERRWKADHTHFANAGMAGVYPHLAQYLERGTAVRLGYLDQDRMQTEVAKLRDGIQGRNCLVTWRLAELLGLEVWLRVFFDQKTAGAPGDRDFQLLHTGPAERAPVAP